MEIYVGTSGWIYDWNEGGSLDWYVKHTGLNAVELNASFYRFPFPSQVKSWARRGSKLRWSVKVHRSITHVRKLSQTALDVWERFRQRFEPLDHLVDFYLFQLPPRFKPTPVNVERIKSFASHVNLGPRMALELRDPSWFTDETVKLCERLGITLVSVDSPTATWLVRSSGAVYLRLHGRSSWYAHDYSDEELAELAEGVAELRPEKVYVFFNNDHWMLGNARKMLRILASF